MNPSNAQAYPGAQATTEDLFLTLASSETTQPRPAIIRPQIKEERKSRLSFGSPKRFSPSRLLSRRGTSDNSRLKDNTHAKGQGAINDKYPSTPSHTASRPLLETQSSGDKRARPVWSRTQTQYTSSYGAIGGDRDSSGDLPEAKRRRFPTDEIHEASPIQRVTNNSLNAATETLGQSTAPGQMIRATTSPMAIPQSLTVQSQDSAEDTSSVWDELAELKSRLQRLELTGSSRMMIAANNTASPASAEPNALPTPETRLATNSYPSQLAAIETPPSSYSLLHSALAKTEGELTTKIYDPLAAAVGNVTELRTALADTTAQRQYCAADLRSIVANLSRDLTDLCLALCEQPGHHEGGRSRRGVDDRPRDPAYVHQASGNQQMTPLAHRNQSMNGVVESSPLSPLEDRRAATHISPLDKSRPSAHLQRAKTGGALPNGTSPNESRYALRTDNVINGDGSVQSPIKDRYSDTPQSRPTTLLRATTGGFGLRSSRTNGTPRPVSSASAYIGLSDAVTSNAFDSDDIRTPTTSTSKVLPGKYVPSTNGRTPESRPFTNEQSHDTSPPVVTPPLPSNNSPDVLRKYSRDYTARYPMPELSPKYSNSELRSAGNASPTKRLAQSSPMQAPTPSPSLLSKRTALQNLTYAASDAGGGAYHTSSPLNGSVSGRRNSTASATRTPAQGRSSMQPSAASVLAKEILERRKLAKEQRAASLTVVGSAAAERWRDEWGSRRGRGAGRGMEEII